MMSTEQTYLARERARRCPDMCGRGVRLTTKARPEPSHLIFDNAHKDGAYIPCKAGTDADLYEELAREAEALRAARGDSQS